MKSSKSDRGLSVLINFKVSYKLLLIYFHYFHLIFASCHFTEENSMQILVLFMISISSTL
jgi:hypothetical protein